MGGCRKDHYRLQRDAWRQCALDADDVFRHAQLHDLFSEPLSFFGKPFQAYGQGDELADFSAVHRRFGRFPVDQAAKAEPLLAFYAALAFMFSCHWLGLVEIGHNTKYRAIMYIPWVVWALFRLFEKPSLLNLGLMASFLITQLRENHPQISYYLYLFVGMFWVYQLITSLQEKQGKRLIMATVLLAAAFVLTALAVMNPYLSNLEYSHYTMRGGAAGLEKAMARLGVFRLWKYSLSLFLTCLGASTRAIGAICLLRRYITTLA
jgi:hypothetical protein